MNRPIEKLIIEPVLNDILKDYLSKFQQAGTKLSDESAKAVEEQFWKLIKPALGETNWTGNNYKGSLQVDEIKKIIQGELKDFKPWTKEQDAENIKEVIGRENFKDGKFKGGLDRAELEKVIGGDWDRKGNYLGNKEYLLEVIKENSQSTESKNELWKVLNSAFDNKFSNGKYTGGWNKETDAAAILEALKPYKTWQETQQEVNALIEKAKTDLKTEITSQADRTKKEANEYTDTKLKPFKNWEETQKEISGQTDKKLEPYKTWDKTKEEIKPIAVKEVVEKSKPGGEVLEHIHLIFGKEKFYPNQWKEGEKFPKDRAGYYKDPVDIAILERDAKKQVEAMDKWDKFFDLDHGITKSEDKKWWMDNYPANPDAAEQVYKKAILAAAEKVGEERPLTELERNAIMTATTPEQINKVVEDIPAQRKKKEWIKFFNKTDLNGEIREEWKEYWEKSGLTIEQAEIVYKNGWRNDPAKGIIEDKQIKENKTIEYVDEQPHEEITKIINPLTHSLIEIEKANTFIIRQIRTQTDLTKFPTDETIQQTFNQDLTPDSLKYDKLKKLRDNARIALFKKYFEEYHEKSQEPQPSGLNDDDIDLWRTEQTGLLMNGADQRKAFNNGWKDPTKIKGGKWPEYKGVKDIDVLKYKPEQVDTAIKAADQVITEINAFSSLRQLEPQEFKNNQAIIDNLKQQTQLLPVGTIKKIDDAIAYANERLYYHLDDPKDGGIPADRLNEIEQAIKTKWTPKNYEPLTTEISNAFIKTYGSKSVKVKGEKEWKTQAGQKVKWDSPNIDAWLIDKGAYEIPKKYTDKEDSLPMEKRGVELLPYFYEKAKFNPENLGDRNSYCVAGTDKTGRPIIQGTQGHLPFGTGVGKSTKVVNCFVGGGEKDEIRGGAGNRVILVMPDQFLVEAIGKHQRGWLQDWGCVFHAFELKAQPVKRGTYIPASQSEIDSGNVDYQDIYKSHGRYEVKTNDLIPKGKKGLSIITGDELLGYMAKDLLLADPTDPISKWKPIKGALGWFRTQEEIDAWRKDAESKIIDKENDIIMFDEGHFAIPRYQAIQVQATANNYRVIRMSATFEGQPFSITSTYPRANLYAGYGGREALDPNMPTGKIRIDKPEQIKRLAELRKTEPQKLGWDDKTKKPIEIDVLMDERLRIGKTAFFVPNLTLLPAQQRALSGIGWIAYTEEWDPYLEPVSFGMSIGCLNILGQQHGVGTNGDFDTVILGGKMGVKTLKKRFQYEYIDEHNLTQADGVQEIGRTARFKIGTGIILSPKWEEIDTKEDVAAAMVNATFDKQVSEIYKKGYEMIQDYQMLRTALAIPYRFGKPAEEILIGLKVDDKTESQRVAGGQPLTQIEWRTRNEPQPDIKIAGFSFGKPDDDLWARYLGDKKPIQMKKEVAKERLLENISTFILEDVNFPKKIEVWRQSNLIEYIWGEEVKSNKAAVIAEIRRVLNGVIKKGIESYSSVDYNDRQKISKKREIIENVADYYNIADAFIDISPQKNEEGKLVLTLQIEKPKAVRN